VITHVSASAHPYRLCISSLSDVGQRSVNEDRIGLLDAGGRALCCVLSDGAGGHGQGDLAARLTVESVLEGFHDSPLFAPAGMASLISMAEHAVAGEQPLSTSRQHMSATVVLLCVDLVGARALWAHWGDSRLYVFRGQALHSHTQDHSVVQQLQQAGLYANADPRSLPNRNVLTGAIGARSQVPPTVLAQALALQPGDAFLLCSDGWWEALDEAEMQAALQLSRSPDVWLETMAATIRARSKVNQDNFSALALWVAANDATN
jgi:serine/threonine protein phosphatase PrpC